MSEPLVTTINESDLSVSPDIAQIRGTNHLPDPQASKPDYSHRHKERMNMVQALFIAEFPSQDWEEVEFDFDHDLLADILAHKAEYDAQIVSVATKRPLQELAKIDLAILRLILHESATKDTPVKVLIDEGVELAKDFGGENSYAFINAVLEKLLLGEKNAQGEFINEIKSDQHDEDTPTDPQNNQLESDNNHEQSAT